MVRELMMAGLGRRSGKVQTRGRWNKPVSSCKESKTWGCVLQAGDGARVLLAMDRRCASSRRRTTSPLSQASSLVQESRWVSEALGNRLLPGSV